MLHMVAADGVIYWLQQICGRWLVQMIAAYACHRFATYGYFGWLLQMATQMVAALFAVECGCRLFAADGV